jgi:hypothetical protein
MTFWGYATWSRQPTWFWPYQMKFPVCKLEVDDQRIRFGAPRWARLLSDGGPIPIIEKSTRDIEGFAQDGCAARLSFRDRQPLWFCPQFGGSIHTLMSRLYAIGISYKGGRGSSRLGLCGTWAPPPREALPSGRQ